MSLAQGNNTPSRPRIEPGSPDPESDALTTMPVRPPYEGMVNQIYPPELKLNKTNTSDTEAPFLDLHLFIYNGFEFSEIYDKRDNFDFDIVNFPFIDGDVPRRPSYGVYISQPIKLLECVVT